jgi:hypothetical protein
MLFQIVSICSTAELPSKEDLQADLAQNCERRTQAGITGLMLYKDGNYMHILEGEEATVRAAFETIKANPRFHGALALLQRPIKRRYFSPDRTIGFDLDSAAVKTLPDYKIFKDFMSGPMNPGEKPSEKSGQKFGGSAAGRTMHQARLVKLIRLFNNNMR